MKKMKFLLAAALICGAAFAGYTAYERATMTEQERALLANLEALTDGEFDRSMDCYYLEPEICWLIVVYYDGSIGSDGLLDHAKKPGWI